MEHNIEEFLTSRMTAKIQLSDEACVDYHYERQISTYRSSTVKIDESWGDTRIVCGEEYHYEEFL